MSLDPEPSPLRSATRAATRPETYRRFGSFLKRGLPTAFSEWRKHDLRWSYLIVGGMFIVGLIVNLFLPHGWTVWPFVAAAGILLYVHEAADRNGQGVPPLRVYGLFAAAVAIWIIVTIILSAVSPLIILGGTATLIYFAVRELLRDRERKRIFLTRRESGQCVHCGETFEPNSGICLNCGLEPDPESAQVARVQAVVKSRAGAHRSRTVLKQQSAAQLARAKEQSLLANRRRPGSRPVPKRNPK